MLNSLINRFIADVCAGKSNETPRAYRNKLSRLAEFLGDCTPNQDCIDQFKRDLLTRQSTRKIPLSRFTVRSVLATVRHFLHWGYERDLWPVIRLENIAEPEPQPKAITEVCFERMVKAAGDMGQEWEQARNIALLYVLRDTGGRVGAIANIDISSLDLVNGACLAPDKGGQFNWLYFNSPTIATLGDWLNIRAGCDPWDDRLWTGQRHTGLTRRGIAGMLNRLAKAAGCERMRHNPHSFRHAFARDVLLAGSDLSQASQLLNHRGIVVTAKYYARWTKNELRSAHKKYSPIR